MKNLKKARDWEHLIIEPGLWLPIDTPHGKSAVCSCPGCGERWALDGWTIAADGSVTPSVSHAPAGCSFHDMIKLEGWTAE